MMKYEPIEDCKVLVNTEIHKKAKLSRQDFLEKVKNVKYIRTRKNSHYISFYITSIEEYGNLKRFYELINNGIFDFEGSNHVFAVAVPNKLYEWFKTQKLGVIERQITHWLASSYFFEIEKREIFEKQLFKPLLEEIKKIINSNYADYTLPFSKDDLVNLEEKDFEAAFLKNYDSQLQKYHEVCQISYGTKPPDFLTIPGHYDYMSEFGVNAYHNFEFLEAYFTKRDWDNIITEEVIDDLGRVESREDFWEKWKSTFSLYEIKKTFVYGYYFEDFDPNKKTQTNKREKITKETMNLVWRRDEGKCVDCGSKEKLEFDHIIPLSKGGASTYRNLQILCERCNRRKHDNI
jgi:HNH endonuclease